MTAENETRAKKTKSPEIDGKPAEMLDEPDGVVPVVTPDVWDVAASRRVTLRNDGGTPTVGV